ncbi:MAG: Peptidyl-prolyl cis-trans isomerase [Mucilaginibacter sp.]|nr:Peptidyl-prolyl cis-trans isomerase [Mucilaginibacter sp.]
MKLKSCFLLLLCPILASFGQDKNTTQKDIALQAGKQVPAITVRVITALNAESTLQLAGYNDRILLLDFWSTSCGSCIQSLPELTALQTRFPDQLKIILVGYEKSDRITRFFRSPKQAAYRGLPVVYSDTLLKKLFAHQYIPHIAWICKGVYLGATGAEQVNPENIALVLQGKNPAGGEKRDQLAFNYSEPVFPLNTNPALQQVKPLWTSAFSGYLPGLPLKAGQTRDSLAGTRRFYAINHPVLHLYALALGSGLPMQTNRRILEGTDTGLVYQKPRGYYAGWTRLHCFSYEVTYPENTPQALVKAKMKGDLDCYLGLSGSIQERQVSCLVLRRAARPAVIKQTVYSPETGTPSDSIRYISAADLAYRLNNLPGFPPVISELDEKQTVQINPRSAAPADIAGWQALLAPCGLSLEQERRQLPMFVLHSNSFIKH